jgi:ribosomal protein S18 acetylase RimI-like enzyme
MSVEYRLVEAGDRVTGLSLGSSTFTPLKTYLQKHAKNHQRASLARTYVAVDTSPNAPALLGYLTLVAGEVAVEQDHAGLVNDDSSDVAYPYLQYPAVKIARLAVDTRSRGRSIGTNLVSLAIAITQLEVARSVGCRFLDTDAKAESVAFYQKAGFSMRDTAENAQRREKVMLIDLLKLDRRETSSCLTSPAQTAAGGDRRNPRR